MTAATFVRFSDAVAMTVEFTVFFPLFNGTFTLTTSFADTAWLTTASPFSPVTVSVPSQFAT